MAKAVTGKINVDAKHLKQGDPVPPYNGKLRIYNMRYCPYAQRTILALNAKKIDYEVVNVSLQDKPEWMNRKSAFGKLPSIEIKEDVCICESSITLEYLDEVYPQRPLLPKDPVRKAFDKIIVEAEGPVVTIFLKTIKSPESITDDNIAAYHKALEFIQDHLKVRGTTFLGGKEPGYVDYMLWPWFEKILVFKKLDTPLNIDEVKFKLLMAYFDKMHEDPAVREYSVPDEIQLKFYQQFLKGSSIDYDLL